MNLTIRLQINTLISEVSIEPNNTITIGRSDKNNIKVPDPLLSGIHCKIIYRPPRLEVTDMESKNGTYLNGLRVEHCNIFVGDEIKIGDTKISILTDKMDPNTIKALTFPGPAKDRVAQSLQLDSAGADTAPQGYAGLPDTERKGSRMLGTGVEERRQTQRKIKLTKKEIKIRYKRLSSLARTFDIIFFIAALGVPLVVSNFFLVLIPEPIKNDWQIFMLSGELICGAIFYIVNLKVLNFTLGEKAAGIQKLYENQDDES